MKLRASDWRFFTYASHCKKDRQSLLQFNDLQSHIAYWLTIFCVGCLFVTAWFGNRHFNNGSLQFFLKRLGSCKSSERRCFKSGPKIVTWLSLVTTIFKVGWLSSLHDLENVASEWRWSYERATDDFLPTVSLRLLTDDFLRRFSFCHCMIWKSSLQ